MRSPNSPLFLGGLLFLAACDSGGEGGKEPEAPACEVEAPAPSTARVGLEGIRIYDDLGRQVLLRGVNAGGRSKMPPFFPFPFAESGFAGQEDAPPFDDAAAEYIDRAVSWGVDVVRLPLSWEALEPTRGTYDEVYLDRYAAFVEAWAARGVRVIVDFHQDVFARSYCGDGFPLWAVPDPAPEVPPAEDCHAWYTGYLGDPLVQAAFDRFWANEDGLMDAYEAMWEHVAARTWPLPGVIGFEVINEPGWGSADPAVWASETLAPFYAHMAEVVRAVAPGAPIFVDSTGRDAVSASTDLPRPDAEDLVFAPHYYEPLVILLGRWDGGKAGDDLVKWAAIGADWQAPVLIGEFGIKPKADGAATYVRKHYEFMDEHLLHATFWEYTATTDDWNDEGMSLTDPGGAERVTVAAMVRAYPRAVAGEIVSFAFDADSLTGTLVYTPDADAGRVTELAAPARLFPEGVSATVSAADAEACARYDAASGTLLVRAEPGEGRVTVTFGPDD